MTKTARLIITGKVQGVGFRAFVRNRSMKNNVTGWVKNQDDGTINLDDIQNSIRKNDDDHFPKTTLLCLENTHNFCYGSPINIDYFNSVKQIINKHNIKLHLDGARIFNAAINS